MNNNCWIPFYNSKRATTADFTGLLSPEADFI